MWGGSNPVPGVLGLSDIKDTVKEQYLKHCWKCSHQSSFSFPDLKRAAGPACLVLAQQQGTSQEEANSQEKCLIHQPSTFSLSQLCVLLLS